MNYPTVRLRRVAEIVNGGTPTSDDENWNGGVIWVTPADLRDHHGGTISDSERTLSPDGLMSSSATLVPPGSVVVSTRAPIGYVAIAGVELATNQGCRALVPGPDLLGPYLALQLSSITDVLDGRGRGTTFMELSEDELASVPILLPPLDAQREAIAQIQKRLQRVSDLVDKNLRMLDLLAEQRRSIVYSGVRGELAGGKL